MLSHHWSASIFAWIVILVCTCTSKGGEGKGEIINKVVSWKRQNGPYCTTGIQGFTLAKWKGTKMNVFVSKVNNKGVIVARGGGTELIFVFSVNFVAGSSKCKVSFKNSQKFFKKINVIIIYVFFFLMLHQSPIVRSPYC